MPLNLSLHIPCHFCRCAQKLKPQPKARPDDSTAGDSICSLVRLDPCKLRKATLRRWAGTYRSLQITYLLNRCIDGRRSWEVCRFCCMDAQLIFTLQATAVRLTG